jgi:ABC-type polysaccharide/polyol phosphate export permease
LNPFSYLVNAYQKLLILGELPSPLHCAVVAGGAMAAFVVGGWVFARGKRIVVDYV